MKNDRADKFFAEKCRRQSCCKLNFFMMAAVKRSFLLMLIYQRVHIYLLYGINLYKLPKIA